MAGRFDLRRESRIFRDWLTRVLNGTVAENIRLEYLFDSPRGVASVRTLEGRVPLRLGARKPTGFIELVYYVGADLSGRFLKVESSFVEISRDALGKEPLLHYDYEREKTGGYPEAHVQIHATSEPWQRFADRDLHKLHLPVGGRRFRPTLEDLVEFLITEGLAEGRPGWQKLVEEGRAWYRRIQTKALVRSDPEPAGEVIDEVGRTA